MDKSVFRESVLGLGSSGLDSIFSDSDQMTNLELNLIDIKEQVRKEFDDEYSTMEEMTASVKEHGVVQPIVVRYLDSAGRYELVCGERRVRASKLAGLTTIPAIIKKGLTDQAAKVLQLEENIQRKNLNQIEIAHQLKGELDELGGDVQALCDRYSKRKSWISKQLGLTKLGKHASELVKRNISADVAVLNGVRIIEELSPEKAKEVVEALANKKDREIELPSNDGTSNAKKTNARDLVIAAKKELKSSGEKKEEETPEKLIDRLLSIPVDNINQQWDSDFNENQRILITNELQPYFLSGQDSSNTALEIFHLIKKKTFSTSGLGVMRFASFVYGTNSNAFDIAAILKIVASE